MARDNENEAAADAIRRSRESVAALKQSFEQNVEAMREVSKLLKAKYDSLIEAGFSAQDALEIIKARGLSG